MKKLFSSILLSVFMTLLIGFTFCVTACKGDGKKEETRYTVTLVVEGEGGTAISDVDTVLLGDDVTLTFTPNEHYQLSSLIINSQTVETSGNTYVCENVQGNLDITVSFEKVLYQITVGEGLSGGDIILDKMEAVYGEKVGFTVLPSRGYAVERVIIGETEYTADECPREIEVKGNVSVFAQFSQVQPVTVTTPTLSGNNQVKITYLDGSTPLDGKFYVGERVLVTLEIESDYRIKWVKINGEEKQLNSVNAVSVQLTDNLTIEVEIAKVLLATFYDGETKVGEYKFFAGDVVKKLEVSIPGYHVLSWHLSKDLSGAAFDFADVQNESIDLYAKKEANEYTVKFHSNTETDATVTQTHVYDTETTLLGNTFERENWFFMGWSALADGSVEYTDLQSVENLSTEENSTVDLYAVWGGIKLPESYDVEEGAEEMLAFTTVNLDVEKISVQWSLETNEYCTLSNATQVEAKTSGVKYGLENPVAVTVTYQGETITQSSVVNVWEAGAKYYILVSTAEEFKALDLVKHNARLTANIDLGDIVGDLKPTNISASYDGASAYKPQAMFEKVEKHLDGNGYKISYNYRCYGDAKYSLIGVLDGKISNLSVDATVRMAYGNAAFIGHAWSDAVIKNCHIKVKTTSDSNDAGQEGIILRFGGKMNNTLIELDSTMNYMHAIAYGPAMNTISTFFTPTFENVVIVAREEQKIFSESTEVEGVTTFADRETMYIGYDFSTWDENLWLVSKDAEENVVSLVFGHENEKAPEEEIEWIAISTVEEFKALNGQSGYYYLTQDLAFTLNDTTVLNGQYSVVNNFIATLDGKGYTITYTGEENVQWHQAFIYSFNGKISNLNFVASVKLTANSSAFVGLFGMGSELTNCYLDITSKNNSAGVDSGYENTIASVCQSVNGGVIKNVIVKSVAYKSDGVTLNTTSKVFARNTPVAEAEISDVLVIADAARDLTGAETEPIGISRYATLLEAYEGYNFSTWSTDVWSIEKEGEAVKSVSIKKE